MTWIKMRSNLWDDPRIARICDLTNKREAEIIGGLYWLWSMADEQTEDGRLDGLSLATIDRKTGIKGFGSALVKVGWIAETEEGVEIAKFDEHNGASAKRRASEAKRMQFVRKSSAERSQPMRTEIERDAQLDKIRIDNTPISPQGDEKLSLEVEQTPAPEHPVLTRCRALFRMQASTPLDASALRAWSKNKKAAAAIAESDWRLLEWAYRQKDGPAATYRRRDLATLLNNITAEVTRARQWAASSPGSLAPLPSPASEPEGWRALIETEYPEVNLTSWAELPESMKNFVRFELRKKTEPAAA